MVRTVLRKIFAMIALVFSLGFAVSAPLAYAQAPVCNGDDCGIAIGGTDKSGEFSALTNMAKTAQTLLVKYAAPLAGTGLVFWGIFKIAMKDTMTGTIALVGGVLLIGIPLLIKNAVTIGA